MPWHIYPCTNTKTHTIYAHIHHTYTHTYSITHTCHIYTHTAYIHAHTSCMYTHTIYTHAHTHSINTHIYIHVDTNNKTLHRIIDLFIYIQILRICICGTLFYATQASIKLTIPLLQLLRDDGISSVYHCTQCENIFQLWKLPSILHTCYLELHTKGLGIFTGEDEWRVLKAGAHKSVSLSGDWCLWQNYLQSFLISPTCFLCFKLAKTLLLVFSIVLCPKCRENLQFWMLLMKGDISYHLVLSHTYFVYHFSAPKRLISLALWIVIYYENPQVFILIIGKPP